MKHFLTLFLVIYGITVQAQIALKITPEKTNNLVFQPITIYLQMENFSGNDLTFPRNAEKPSLYFEIRNAKGNEIARIRNDQDPVAGLNFGAGVVLTRELILNNVYELRYEGSYTCRAMISHPLMENEYQSNLITFQVANPPVISQYNVGKPLKSGETKLQTLTYSILIFESNAGPQYCLRIEDKNLVYKTLALAMKKTNYPPTFAVDSQSNLHTLIYVGPSMFEYIVISTDGEFVNRDVYKAIESTPRLIKERNTGKVSLEGGSQALEGIDYISDDMHKRKEKEAQLPKARNIFEADAIEKKADKVEVKVEKRSIFDEEIEVDANAPKSEKNQHTKSIFDTKPE